MRKFVVALLSLALLLPLTASAADQGDLLQKIEALSRELESLKSQMHEMQKKETVKEERITMVEKKAEAAETPSWFKIGGDIRTRYDYLKGTVHDYFDFADVLAWMGGGPAPAVTNGGDVKNDSLLTTRFGLNMEAKATEDVTVKARLLMYKVWGHETSEPIAGNSAFFADRANIFDGNIAHIPQDNTLRVDQAYASWSNVFGQPIWFSVGRRPSTGGIPTNIRQNVEKIGNAGVPGFLIDYAFDGATLGYAPDIDALPGAYAKVCYGRGFDSGFRPNNGLKDVDFVGINVVPYDTDVLHIELQWDRAFNLFGFPESRVNNAFNINNTNLGDVDQYGLIVMGKLDKLGPGDLNLFGSVAMSRTHPNDNTLFNFAGLMYDANEGPKDRTGMAYYVGARYDIAKTGTKIGAEYNYGTKYWLAFAPASDDMWTGKLGTHGSVYELYVIQELNKKPIAKRGKAFFRLGYQYYDFEYTGSNNWVGKPKKIGDELSTNPLNAQMFAPLEKAHDVYLTFDVLF
ncbi:MAG: DUF3373 domain-containing protein [Nitrospirota bacterium]